MKKRRVIKKKVLLFIILLIMVILVIVFFPKKKVDNKPVVEEVKVVEKLDDYGYELHENETDYYKNLFEELKKELNKDDTSDEQYAELIAKLFVADFFNLGNKVTKNDIGGTQYVFKDYQDDFESFAKDTIYKYVESDIYKDRKQELPIVRDVTIKKIEKTKYKYQDEKKDAYLIEVAIDYEKDLGYQKKAILNLIYEDNRIVIASME